MSLAIFKQTEYYRAWTWLSSYLMQITKVTLFLHLITKCNNCTNFSISPVCDSCTKPGAVQWGQIGYGPGRDTDSLISQPPPIFAQIIDMKTYCEVLSPITLKVESYKILLCHRNFLSQIQRSVLIIWLMISKEYGKALVELLKLTTGKPQHSPDVIVEDFDLKRKKEAGLRMVRHTKST